MAANWKKNYLRLLVLVIIISLIFSACATPPQATPASVEKVVTQVVKETVIVAGTPQVVEKVVTPTPEPVQVKKTLTVGLPTGFEKLDPGVTTFTEVVRITMQMTDQLVWETAPGTYVPGLAKEWSVNADATEYTFKLRDDVKFHDGTPFNAEAVKFTFDRIMDPATKSQVAISLLGPYKETDVLNDYEVVVKFSTPYAPFLDSVAQPYLAIISPSAVKAAGEDNWGITTFVGTGPYKFESMVLNDNIVMVRNPDYAWGPKELGMDKPPFFDKITYKFISEDATRTAALLTGQIDFLIEVPAADFGDLSTRSGFKATQMVPSGIGYALMFNQELPPTNELAVRRAMQLALDKQGIVDTVFNGYGTPACAMISKSTFGYDPATCDMYPYNLDEANKTLQDAGWIDTNGDGIREKNGQNLVVKHYYRADDPITSVIAPFLKDNFTKIGIDFQLNGLARTGYFDAVRAGKHNTQNWWETLTDPDMLLRPVLYSAFIHGGTNRNNLVDKDLDSLLDKAAGEPDLAKRADLYHQILKRVKDNADMENLVDQVILYANNDKLTGVIYYMAGTYPYFPAASFVQ